MARMNKKLTGIPVSEGIAAGPVHIFRPYILHYEEKRIEQVQTEEELHRFRDAEKKACTELDGLIGRVKLNAPDKVAIFEAQKMLLTDEEVIAEIEEAIAGDRKCAEWAADSVYAEFTELLAASADPLIQERAADMNDVARRLLRCLAGAEDVTLAAMDSPAVVVAEDLLPSDTVVMDRRNVLGLITEKGGTTSHTAILARSFSLPAVCGAAGAMDALASAQTVVLDAVNGAILADPEKDVLAEYREKRERLLRRQELEREYLYRTVTTKDGEHVDVELNIGSAKNSELKLASCADGVGLFRTEFLYMNSAELPNEETQFQAYKKILQAFAGKPVVIRTLDVGGDKVLPSLPLPKEENPFLGCRALRLCLQKPELFQTQLRALLRASVYGELWIMFPMVGSLDDIRAAKKAVALAGETLRKQGAAFDPHIRLGAMVEIPALALIAGRVAREVDFVSVGTNDLCQYLMAADRMNAAVTPYYQSFHPAMLSILQQVADAFRAAGKPFCICGEMGGEPAFVLALLGMGFRRLSMSPSRVAAVKRLIASVDRAEAETIAEKALELETADEVEAYLRAELSRLCGAE